MCMVVHATIGHTCEDILECMYMLMHVETEGQLCMSFFMSYQVCFFEIESLIGLEITY